jgi:DNA polymerase III delta prime subunit
MNELQNLIWTEKYRPSTLSEVILDPNRRSVIERSMEKNSMPSFIFYSSKPGTGKTSTAKAMINDLECDHLLINSSDERGIDVIRDKIKAFATALSSNGKQRCIFLDEADGLTKVAQDSLRNLMETYTDNCFFILSCNDVMKVIEPIRSRCLVLNFDTPPMEEVEKKVLEILDKEEYNAGDIYKLIKYHYPDIRSIIKTLQEGNLRGKELDTSECGMDAMLEAIKKKDLDYLYKTVYSGKFDIMVFNKWLFRHVFENATQYGFKKCSDIADKLADTEKSWNQGANLEVVFISNILRIMDLL